jgi:hypothetical protein
VYHDLVTHYSSFRALRAAAKIARMDWDEHLWLGYGDEAVEEGLEECSRRSPAMAQ